jgi:hypothetical protein
MVFPRVEHILGKISGAARCDWYKVLVGLPNTARTTNWSFTGRAPYSTDIIGAGSQEAYMSEDTIGRGASMACVILQKGFKRLAT